MFNVNTIWLNNPAHKIEKSEQIQPPQKIENESECMKQSTPPPSKLNDDNNNIICDNRSTTSEIDCCSLASSGSRTSLNGFAGLNGVNNNNIKAINGGEGFQYETINGCIIKSVVAPGKGIRVDYKVSGAVHVHFSHVSTHLTLHVALVHQ